MIKLGTSEFEVKPLKFKVLRRYFEAQGSGAGEIPLSVVTETLRSAIGADIPFDATMAQIMRAVAEAITASMNPAAAPAMPLRIGEHEIIVPRLALDALLAISKLQSEVSKPDTVALLDRQVRIVHLALAPTNPDLGLDYIAANLDAPTAFAIARAAAAQVEKAMRSAGLIERMARPAGHA
jgi:hypothetical protein